MKKPILISIAILLVAVPVVYAAEFRGRTSQDRPVLLRTDRDGFPKRITIKWHARCEDNARLTLRTTFLPPYREATRTFVRDRGRYTTLVPDAENEDRIYKVHVRTRIRGHLETVDEWRGRFRAAAEVRRNGRHVTDCNKRGIRWRATS